MTWIEADGNAVRVVGALGLADYKKVLATLYKLTSSKGYEDIKIDLSGLGSAYAGPILALGADVARMRDSGVDVEFLFPTDEKLWRLFRNAGWLKLLSPSAEAPPSSRSDRHVPVVSFRTGSEQFDAANRMIDAVLASLPGLTRHDLGALEWAINEVSDNVLAHAESPVGGLVQLSAFAEQRRVELTVADAGIGIPETLRQAWPELFPDSRALEKAVQEGVTRSKAIGRGNGLFGTLEIARVSKGYIHIHSGYGRLHCEDDRLALDDDKIPFHGTLVVVSLDCADPGALGRALRFDGEQHEPLDLVDMRFATDEGDIQFVISRDSPSIGSREAGEAFRTKIENLLEMRPDARLVLDFTGTAIVSSSFADEVVGKLFAKLGPLGFMSRVVLKGVSPTVRGLLDRALMQRTLAAPE
jgi:hypothetical protein